MDYSSDCVKDDLCNNIHSITHLNPGTKNIAGTQPAQILPVLLGDTCSSLSQSVGATCNSMLFSKPRWLLNSLKYENHHSSSGQLETVEAGCPVEKLALSSDCAGQAEP